MKQRFGLILGFLATSALGCSLPVAAEEPPTPDLPIQELRAFADIFGRIKQSYVEPVDDKQLLEYAIRGMLSGLDPHSAYLDTKEFTELQEGTSGKFGGLGIEVGTENGFVKVISPIDDTPAQRAGVKAGDLIIRLDEKPVKDMSLNEAVKLMRGAPGSKIVLTIVRENSEKPINITIIRDFIKVASVKGRILEPGYGYLRISHFRSRTTEDMLKKVSTLKKDSDGELKGLVLDLRNNPGGILNGAVAVSDAFLTEGIIVFTKGRNEGSRMEFKAAPDDILDGAPIVVLVNGGSASASEIVAGALQDHRRAVIMGSQSFGKGSVQTIVPVNKTSAVKLTTARYYTPSGRSIQGDGIVPDIELSNIKVTTEDVPVVGQIKESDLSGHLDKGKEEGASGNKSKPGEGKKSSEAGEEKASENLATKDFYLNEALTLLKGLNILHGK